MFDLGIQLHAQSKKITNLLLMFDITQLTFFTHRYMGCSMEGLPFGFWVVTANQVSSLDLQRKFWSFLVHRNTPASVHWWADEAQTAWKSTAYSSPPNLLACSIWEVLTCHWCPLPWLMKLPPHFQSCDLNANKCQLKLPHIWSKKTIQKFVFFWVVGT